MGQPGLDPEETNTVELSDLDLPAPVIYELALVGWRRVQARLHLRKRHGYLALLALSLFLAWLAVSPLLAARTAGAPRVLSDAPLPAQLACPTRATAHPPQLALAGVAVEKATGNILIADLAYDRIQVFSATGRHLVDWGCFGVEAGQFNFSLNQGNAIAVGARGNIYIADAGNHRVDRFDGRGRLVLSWSTAGSSADVQSQVDDPVGIATDRAGRVYVAEFGIGRIQVFTPDGHLLTTWESSGQGTGKLAYPVGIAVSASG